MLQNINHQIWFKVCRPFRHKYKLSVNCLLVLNGCYVFNKIVGTAFTRRKLIDFCSYYDGVRMNKYFSVLFYNGYAIESGKQKTRQLYCISSLGIQVIQELNESYNKELNKFIEQYNISL